VREKGIEIARETEEEIGKENVREEEAQDMKEEEAEGLLQAVQVLAPQKVAKEANLHPKNKSMKREEIETAISKRRRKSKRVATKSMNQAANQSLIPALTPAVIAILAKVIAVEAILITAKNSLFRVLLNYIG